MMKEIKSVIYGTALLAIAGLTGCQSTGNVMGGLENALVNSRNVAARSIGNARSMIPNNRGDTGISPISWDNVGTKKTEAPILLEIMDPIEKKVIDKPYIAPVVQAPSIPRQEAPNPELAIRAREFQKREQEKVIQLMLRNKAKNAKARNTQVTKYVPQDNNRESELSRVSNKISTSIDLSGLDGGVNQFLDRYKTKETADILTEVLYAEGRSVRERGKDIPSVDYLESLAASVINRSQDRDQSPLEVVTANEQYSYLNDDDPGKNIAGRIEEHAKKSNLDWAAYLVCKEVAEKVIRVGTNKDHDHYFVREVGVNDHNIPSYYAGVEPIETTFHEVEYESGTRIFVTRFYDLEKPKNKRTILASRN